MRWQSASLAAPFPPFKIFPDGEGYFGTIEGLQGVWANAKTLEACREALREALEE
jgi:predicted RNase H-like HicB family nuclease